MAPLLAQRPRVDRAFERLYRRHVSDVYHYALAVLRNPADAEDVTQTAFLNAYSAYRRGERPASPRNWLIAIAHNVCRQRFRQSARRPHEVAFDEDVADTLAPDDDGPTARDIQNALGQLAFNQRAALVMRELEGRSYGEIAELLDLSVSAVETLIFRARRALREQLEGALTCRQAEAAISRQMDGRLSRAERGALRAHLRSCSECASFARSQRAQRAALRSIAAIPLPSTLASFFGGGATAGAGFAIKAAAVVAAGAVVTGIGYEGAKRLPASTERAAADARSSAAGDARGSSASANAAAIFAVREAAAAPHAVARAPQGASRANSGRAAVANGRKVVKLNGNGNNGAAKVTRKPTRGNSAAAPGHTKPRALTGRQHPKKAQRTRPSAPPGQTKAKPNAHPSGGSDKPDKPEPPRQGKKSKVPVTQPTVSVPAVPQPPLPEVPARRRIKK